MRARKYFRIVHFALTIIGLIIWGLANVLYSICVGLAVVADSLVPNSTVGNCWSFALSRWWKSGGYIAIRRSDNNGFLKFLPLPHIIWIKRMDWNFAEIEHLVPAVRRSSKWFPWYAVYFDGRISNKEAPHDVAGQNE
jgi:hypothetical protein